MNTIVFSKNWLLGTIPLTLAGAIGLFLIITLLVRTIRDADLVKVPLQPLSMVEFTNAGPVQMHLEGPQLTRAFAGLHYEVVALDSGQAVPISRLVLPMTSSGGTIVRMLHGNINVPAPGRYELRVAGLRESSPAKCRIVFTRPYTLTALFCTLGIVASALAFIGGTVLSLIILGMTKR